MISARIVLPLLAVLMAGCTSVNNLIDAGKTDYKSASRQSLPPLEIPPNLTRPGGDDRFAVPSSGGSTTFSAYSAERGTAPKAGSTELLPNLGKVRMERAGTQRWLVVPEPPEKVWPIVKEFWQEAGFLVNVEIPESGVMETDWAENRAKLENDPVRNVLGRFLDQVFATGERDKFRTRLERGPEPGTTEIYISHRGLEEVSTGQSTSSNSAISFVWQPRPPSPELEAEFLGKLMVRFGVDSTRAREIIAGAPRVERSKFVKVAEGGAGLLELDEPFDRAWRRVGLALDRVGFTVEDRDRSQGFYFVRYVDPATDAAGKQNEGGLMSRLAFWRSNKDQIKPEQQYRVQVKDTNDVSRVQVMTREGGPDRSDVAQKILGLLHDQLK